MKKTLIILSIFTSLFVFAEHGWQRVNHMQSTIFSAHVSLNGEQLTLGDTIAAFAGDECRMVSSLIFINDSSFVSGVIHGDVPETIDFRLWLKEKDTIINCKETIMSKPGGDILNYQINFVMKD